MTQGTLIIFAREPLPGAVKTRLIPLLGARGSAWLYRMLLEQALGVAGSVPKVRRELWCAGTLDSASICASLARRFGVHLRAQPDGDLGSRMAHAFAQVLDSAADSTRPHGPVVLIGSDCPGYHRGYIEQAFRALSITDGLYDAVLGPAIDGGYVLIGLRRPAPLLFADMPWGTETVLARTRAVLGGLALRWLELPALADIDRPEDLEAHPELAQRLAGRLNAE